MLSKIFASFWNHHQNSCGGAWEQRLGMGLMKDGVGEDCAGRDALLSWVSLINLEV